MEPPITELEFNALRDKFPKQFKLIELTYEKLAMVDDKLTYRSKYITYAPIKNSNTRSLKFNSLMLDLHTDFEYLTVFRNVSHLELTNKWDYAQYGDLGTNLFMMKHLTSLVIGYHVVNYSDDFARLVPRLESLWINGLVTIGMKSWNFTNLKTLKVGHENYNSDTDFSWCRNLPMLETFEMVSMTPYRKTMENFDFTLISTHIKKIKLIDTNLVALNKSSWVMLLQLEEIFLQWTGLSQFPYFLSSLPNLKKLDCSNSGININGHYPNDFSGQALVFDKSWVNLTRLSVTNAIGNQIVTFDTNGAEKDFELKNISSVDSRFYPEGLDFPESEEDRGCNLAFVGPRRITKLETIGVSGFGFFYETFFQPNLISYNGNYYLNAVVTISLTEMGNGLIPRRIPNVFTMAINHPEVREEIYGEILGTNHALAEDEVGEGSKEQIIYNFNRKEPIACYVPDDVVVHMSEPSATCPICFDPFESTTTIGCVSNVLIALAFLGELNEEFVVSMLDKKKWTEEDATLARFYIKTQPVFTGHTRVCCNILKKNVKNQEPLLSNKVIEERIESHYNHLYHLSCFAAWVFEHKTCPVARTKFVNE